MKYIVLIMMGNVHLRHDHILNEFNSRFLRLGIFETSRIEYEVI